MVGAVVVLNEPSPNLGRCRAHHGIEIYIVTRFASESLDADRPFLQVTCVAKQCLLDGVCEQHWVSLAVGEQRVRDDASQLFSNLYRTW
jgi:hypothetical protein